VNYYHVDFDEELRHVSWAVQYFDDWGREIESSDYDSDYLKQYYSGYTAKTAWVRFRALFFAMRLQPVLSYIEQFQHENRRPPSILDLGCGFGREAILLGLYGAQVHGVDVSPEKIEVAGKIKQIIAGKQRTSLDLNFGVTNLFALRHRRRTMLFIPAPPCTILSLYPMRFRRLQALSLGTAISS
jgi:SAM-dependent methyltransferase